MFVFLEKPLFRSILHATLMILAIAFPIESLLSREQKIPEQLSVIDKLPYTIDKSGNYYLAHDFDMTNQEGWISIVIKANDVDLDLGQHVLTLGTGSKGIDAVNVSNLSIRNGTIMANKPTGNPDNKALTLVNVTHGSFEKLSIVDACIGAFVADCIDLHFVDCKFDHNYFSIWNDRVKGETIRDCTFSSVLDSIKVYYSAEDVNIHHCNFHISIGECIDICGCEEQQTSNVEIADCKFLIDYSPASLGIRLGGVIANAKIRNCTFLNNGDPSPAIICSRNVDLVVEGCSTPLNKIETRKNGAQHSPNGFRIW